MTEHGAAQRRDRQPGQFGMSVTMGGLGGSVAMVAGISLEPSPSRQVNRGQAPVTAQSKLDTAVLPRLDGGVHFSDEGRWTGRDSDSSADQRIPAAQRQKSTNWAFARPTYGASYLAKSWMEDMWICTDLVRNRH